MSKPSVGRTVHYHSYRHMSNGDPDAGKPRAAIITGLSEHGDARVDLAVLSRMGMSFKYHIAYSEDPAPGCWSWPPRE